MREEYSERGNAKSAGNSIVTFLSATQDKQERHKAGRRFIRPKSLNFTSTEETHKRKPCIQNVFWCVQFVSMTFLRCSKMYFAFCEYWLSEIRTWVWCVSAKRVYHCATWSSGGLPLRPSGGECSVLGGVHGAHNFACTRPEVHWGSTLGLMHTSRNFIPSAHGFITHLGGGCLCVFRDPSLILDEGRTLGVDGVRTRVWCMWYKKFYHCTRGSLPSRRRG